ncbi:hypothetical protein Vadar_009627 [Vaccinium darrowii]|uniref:Uncharacterized protein n=1 Tax=Vaccinium darrowii TaxID=229202 RepID=A0ACB7Z2S2_9ERIC|nr:hypothetical protein Vadar_009627 [Vaccinium darrowii]
MMPLRFMSKLDTHQIKFQDRTITVKVVDHADMVSPYLTELKSLIGASTAVGLEVGYFPDKADLFKLFVIPKEAVLMLKLSVGTCCLLIQLSRLDSVPECLKEFLADPEICFVGVGMRSDLAKLKTHGRIDQTNGINVSDLAVKVLKKSCLDGCALEDVADIVGVALPEDPGPAYDVDLEAKFYTSDEIKRLIYEVDAAHLIGTKLLGML